MASRELIGCKSKHKQSKGKNSVCDYGKKNILIVVNNDSYCRNFVDEIVQYNNELNSVTLIVIGSCISPWPEQLKKYFFLFSFSAEKISKIIKENRIDEVCVISNQLLNIKNIARLAISMPKEMFRYIIQNGLNFNPDEILEIVGSIFGDKKPIHPHKLDLRCVYRLKKEEASTLPEEQVQDIRGGIAAIQNRGADHPPSPRDIRRSVIQATTVSESTIVALKNDGSYHSLRTEKHGTDELIRSVTTNEKEENKRLMLFKRRNEKFLGEFLISPCIGPKTMALCRESGISTIFVDELIIVIDKPEVLRLSKELGVKLVLLP